MAAVAGAGRHNEAVATGTPNSRFTLSLTMATSSARTAVTPAHAFSGDGNEPVRSTRTTLAIQRPRQRAADWEKHE
jgi:hypothetical protein